MLDKWFDGHAGRLQSLLGAIGIQLLESGRGNRLVVRLGTYREAELGVDVNAIDELVAISRFRRGDVRVVTNGILQEPGTKTIGGPHVQVQLDNHDIIDRFVQGATIVIEGLDTFSVKLTQLAYELASRYSAWISMNAYLTPPNAQGFAPHSDDHDVLVLQVAGSKTWFYESGKGVSQSLNIARGQAMYIPKGTKHWAITSAVASAHITIAIKEPLEQDILMEAFGRALQHHSIGAHEWSTEGCRVVSEMAATIGEARNKLSVAQRERHPRLAIGRVARAFAEDAVSEDEVIEIDEAATVVRASGGCVTLRVLGRETRLPDRFEEALRDLVKRRVSRVKEIECGACDGEREALVRELLIAGLVSSRAT